MRPQRRHSLHRNDRVWTPHHVGFFDTEFPIDPSWKGAGQPFKCACALALFRHGKGRQRCPVSAIRTTDPEQLATWVEAEARGGVPLWLYAHHLAVDLQASDLLNILLRRGWELTRQGLANQGAWAHLRRGRCSIRLCDTASLTMTSEADLGYHLGIPKLGMPNWGDGLDEWLDYCWRDVEIGMSFLEMALDQWEARRLGRWTDTGPGCGWNALRHTINERTVWIDPDDAARSFERSSIYAGRREVTRVGQLPLSEYVDLDMGHAHASVAARFPLPFGRGIRFEGLPQDSKHVLQAMLGIIARVRVRAREARYPLRTDRGVCYPVGEFWTVLPGPEIQEARARGELLEIGPGIHYQLSDWTWDYARWVCAVVDREVEGVPEAFRLIVKGWSKSVWGRCALRSGGTVEVTEGPHDQVVVERGMDHSAGDRITMLHHSWKTWTIHQDQEGDDSFPAVLAWIQSWVRVLVGRLVDAIGAEHVVQVATDGVLCDPLRLADLALEAGLPIDGRGDTSDVARTACKLLGRAVAPLDVRLKDILRRVELLGPDHLIADQVRKLAGVPLRAKQAGRHVYEGEVWHSFAQLTQLGGPGEVVVGHRRWDVSRVRPMRWVFEDGCAEPLEAAVRPDGATALLGPSGSPCALHGAPLDGRQHPALAGLMTQDGLSVLGRAGHPPSVREAWPGVYQPELWAERRRLGK